MNLIQGTGDLFAEPDWMALFTDELEIAAAREHWRIVTTKLRDRLLLAASNGHSLQRLVCACLMFDRIYREVLENCSVMKPRLGNAKAIAWISPCFEAMREAGACKRVWGECEFRKMEALMAKLNSATSSLWRHRVCYAARTRGAWHGKCVVTQNSTISVGGTANKSGTRTQADNRCGVWMRRNILPILVAGLIGFVPIAVALFAIDPALFKERRAQVIDGAKEAYDTLARRVKDG